MKQFLALLSISFLFINCGKKKEFNEIIGYEYADNDSTLLWEISGNGLKQPSYLYGTIHIQRKEVFDFDTVVRKIFDTCSVYAMEINMDEVSILKSAKLMKMDTPLDQLIAPDRYRLLDSLYQAQTGSAIGAMKYTKPFFLMSRMMMDEIGGDMPLALDLFFFDLAKKNKKKVIGIEKFEEQIAAIDELTIEEQVNMILDNYKDTSSAQEKMQEMIATYLKGDLEGMVKLTEDTIYPAKFNKAFLWDRNIKMAERIAEIAKNDRSFNAVGAGHLGGEKGVIALLRKNGYTVRPIKTTFKSK